MSQRLEVHPTHPHQRTLRLAVDALNAGGLVAYPTDTTYALACHIGDKRASDRIIALRRLHKHHQLTLACRDLSDLGTYAIVDNMSYRLLKRFTPGPFTFILKATREVPKRLVHAKRRSIGIRVPNDVVAQSLLDAMGEPLLTTTLRLAGAEEPLTDGHEIKARLDKEVDIILDAGPRGTALSTIVDLSSGQAELVRQGLGEIIF